MNLTFWKACHHMLPSFCNREAGGPLDATHKGSPVQDNNTHQPLFALIKLLVCIGIMAVVAVAIIYSQHMVTARDALRQSTIGSLFLICGSLFLLINVAVLIWRIVLVCRYHLIPACRDEELPQCTVVVPAYNEGKQVLLTLRSLAASHYPEDKLQIIAVDDGSVDDTWHWIKAGEKELRGKVKALRLPFNRGKRHALCAGFKKSRGDILVTVDSDSIVDPQTLRRLVSPFVRDRRVGAMAGNVRVLNREEGIIPRMLDVIFLYSFDFIRASQSMVDTVMCTPGALSAYRRDVVLSILQEWLAQTFFGKPANIGEDRAMTNLILRQGYHVHFQRDAMVYTQVPTHYKDLCKMFLRWARSNIRETLVMCCFAFHTFRREGSMLGARINLLHHCLTLIKSQFLLVATMAYMFLHPSSFGLQVLFGTVITSSLMAALYAWRKKNTDFLWAYLYSIFWLVGLTWITPYAMITPHRSGWLTRQVKKQKERPNFSRLTLLKPGKERYLVTARVQSSGVHGSFKVRKTEELIEKQENICFLSIPRPITWCKIPGASNLGNPNISSRYYNGAKSRSTFRTNVPHH